ncbi:hypothetical protein GGI43DRAFT_410501 [Trichoderma evansii]
MPSGTPLNSLLSRPLWALGFLPGPAFIFPDLRRFFDSPIFYISRHQPSKSCLGPSLSFSLFLPPPNPSFSLTSSLTLPLSLFSLSLAASAESGG